MKKITKITPEMTATAVSMAHEAECHHKMMLKLANAIITGKIDSEIVKYAEMLVDIDKKEKELFI